MATAASATRIVGGIVRLDMSKNPTSFRLSDYTLDQISQLTSYLGETRPGIVRLAIDRMFREERKMNEITNHYGRTIDFDAAVNLMDDELREQIHNEMAPCSQQEFFDRYAVAHYERFGEEWEPAKPNPVW